MDLNHTLVYLTMEKPNKDTTTYVQIPNKNETPAYVIKRPGLDLFIKEMSALFNICIYTAKKAKVPSGFFILILSCKNVFLVC